MKNRKKDHFVALAVFALLLLPAAAFAQDKPAEEQPAERGMVEFGVRYVWGDVYGRPDLLLGPSGPAPTGNTSPTGPPAGAPGCLGCGTAFDPLLRTSKYEEYRDLRNGFFVRRFNSVFDNILNSKNYVAFQTQRTLYRDQSYLATFGQYGKFKIQFRYDEIPHVYSDTTRTLYTQASPGVWTFPAQVRSSIQAAANIPSFVAGTGVNAGNGVVTDFNFITPNIIRKGGTLLASYNVTPDLTIYGLFFRESQNGFRPIGLIMNSSPSASATSGFGVELPEAISYFNNLVRAGMEYGKRSWVVQGAYIGSFFQQNIAAMVWDNPFLLNQAGPFPAGQTAVNNPINGRMTLYPNNNAQYLNLAGATDLGRYFRLMLSVSPGWLHQNEPFLPYTINTAITGCGFVAGASCTTTASLPAPNLAGDKHTIAANGTLVTLPWKSFQIKAGYRFYDYSNNTPIRTFTPVEGDSSSPPTVPGTGVENTPFAFVRKNFALTGNWYFAKRSSAKVLYEAEWVNRSFRDVEHSLENSVGGAVDVGYWKDLLIRLSYVYSHRKPNTYLDDANSTDAAGNVVPCVSNSPPTFSSGDEPCMRRFDESERVRNRADGLIQYSPTSKLTLSAFGGTIQDNYNQAGGTNGPLPAGNVPTPLNFLTGANANISPYYLYGILKDISYNYGFGGDFAVSHPASLFAEYSHEHYYRRMISRSRTPATPAGGDTNNNDWLSTTPEPVDIWTAGLDTHVGKKSYFTAYYSLSAGRANTFSTFLGVDGVVPAGNAFFPGVNCVNTAAAPQPACRFLLVGTSAAVSYPETVNRQHEVVAIFKYKLTKNLWPKFEFRYQQFDNKDYQTSPMTQYMGCMSGAGAPGSVVGCPITVVNSATSPTPTLSPNGAIGFYPYFQVGDNSSARYLFLGVDQPSYHAYYVSATLEYHF